MLVILLMFFIWFILVDVKNLFKGTKVLNLKEETEKQNTSYNEYKGFATMVVILYGLFLNSINIWAAVALDNPVVTIMAAVMVLLVFKGMLKTLKMIEKGNLVSSFSLTRIYSLVFDGYVLYLLVMMIFSK